MVGTGQNDRFLGPNGESSYNVNGKGTGLGQNGNNQSNGLGQSDLNQPPNYGGKYVSPYSGAGYTPVVGKKL